MIKVKIDMTGWVMSELGSFDDKNNAIFARLQAEAKYYKDFAPQKHLFSKYNIIMEE